MDTRMMDDTTLIALSTDQRSLDPNTIRQVIRANAIGENPRHTADLEFFLDCVTVRHLLEQKETARAMVCAQQIGCILEDFAPPVADKK